MVGDVHIYIWLGLSPYLSPPLSRMLYKSIGMNHNHPFVTLPPNLCARTPKTKAAVHVLSILLSSNPSGLVEVEETIQTAIETYIRMRNERAGIPPHP